MVEGSEDEFDALINAGPTREKTSRRAASKVINYNWFFSINNFLFKFLLLICRKLIIHF
jgi:hypothetical protein